MKDQINQQINQQMNQQIKEQVKQEDKQYIANTYGRFDLLLTRGKGARAWDEAGREYIDLGAGIAVNTFGYGDEEWQQAVIAQLGRLQHTSNLYYTEPQVQLAKLLCEKTGMKKVFFSNSGAEANECAIKTARKYGTDKYGAERNVIITLKDSFHGRTITTLAATGQDAFHTHFTPFTEGFVHVPAGDLPAMKEAMENPRVCAVMLELIQGEGGLRVIDPEYAGAVALLAKEKDILLLIDEVQTGNGRTGALYAYMNYGLEPDVVSTAKGLAGGLPMGATLFNEKTQGVLGAGDHGSTFGGNPVCAAGAVSIISRLTPELLAEVKAKGDYLRQELEDAPGVEEVSGLGLMLGIRPAGITAKEAVAEAIGQGLILLTAKEKIRLLPPLNISWEELKKSVKILKSLLGKQEKNG